MDRPMHRAHTSAVSAEKDIAVHLSPIWRKKGNFLIQAELSAVGLPSKSEQLWARQLDGGRSELCCIPFFAPGFSLAGQVDVAPKDGAEYVVYALVADSGHVRPEWHSSTMDAEFEKLAHQLIDECAKQTVSSSGLPEGPLRARHSGRRYRRSRSGWKRLAVRGSARSVVTRCPLRQAVVPRHQSQPALFGVRAAQTLVA
jgi:hypothetical protein